VPKIAQRRKDISEKEFPHFFEKECGEAALFLKKMGKFFPGDRLSPVHITGLQLPPTVGLKQE